MADFTQTITGGVNVFGQADVELWGTLVWGTDDWANDDDMEFQIEKVYTTPVSISVAQTFDATHSYTSPVTVSVANTFDVGKLYTSTANVSSTFTTIVQTDEAGYSVVYPSRTTNIVSLASGGFTHIASASDGFTTFTTANSVTWSLL